MNVWGLRQLLGGEMTLRRLAKSMLTTVVAFGLGAALLGLAGWFIAASAVAGLAVASTFSFLFPSAGVQALAWARTLGRYGERITTHQATLDLVATLRANLFARAVNLPRGRVAELRSSELLGRITVDSDAIENLLLRAAFPALAALAALLVTAVAFALLSPWLAIAAVSGLLLAAAVLVGLAHHRAGAAARGLVAARADARRALIETLDGLPELRSYGAEQGAAAEVTGRLDSLDLKRGQLRRLEAGGQGVGMLLTDATLIAVIVIAGGLTGTASLSAPAFVAVCLVAIAVFEPIIALPKAATALARARAASARLVELFPDTSDSRDNLPPSAADTLTEPMEIRLGAQHAGLALASGRTVLLTGASGTGKSTLLRAVAEQWGNEQVTLVAQDAHVFDATIRENLNLADPGAGEPELWSALAAAALDDTVAGFPSGLDTPVGPGGVALSGGQRRRLSVAQGVLRHARLLLLDEPTEGLDGHTAARLLAGIRAYDRSARLVIALHDRQSPPLPWTPDACIELRGAAIANGVV